jgi:predicted transposase YbfD/YdcC
LGKLGWRGKGKSVKPNAFQNFTHGWGANMAKDVDGEDIVSILDYFKDLEDPRSHINRLHLLGDLIVISIAAVLSGADGPKAIGVWAKANEAWIREYLSVPNGIPSHDTIGRLLATLNPRGFQTCFTSWLSSLRTDDESTEDLTQERGKDNTIAIDGKALRRSHDNKNQLGPLFLVSAWSTKYGMSLGQLATEEKSNEITAIPELIDNIEIENAIVTIDAAGCQRNIANQVIERGGDYVLALKGNQGTLHDNVRQWILDQWDNDFADVDVRAYETASKGHGREDHLMYYQFKVPRDFPGRDKWRGLRTVGLAIRASEKDGKTTSDVRHFISSLPLGVKRFANAVRSHWGIENTLHWCLDVTFREDESRLRDRVAGDNVAWLKRFAISLLKQQTDKESIAMRRRIAGWNLDYLAQVLGLKRT